jgi:hypothetical protein
VVADRREHASIAKERLFDGKKATPLAVLPRVTDEVTRVEQEIARRPNHFANDERMRFVVRAVVAVEQRGERLHRRVDGRRDERSFHLGPRGRERIGIPCTGLESTNGEGVHRRRGVGEVHMGAWSGHGQLERSGSVELYAYVRAVRAERLNVGPRLDRFGLRARTSFEDHQK